MPSSRSAIRPRPWKIFAPARASTGSIYHHFTSKEQLAGELYLTGLQDYQQGLLAALTRTRSAEAGIKAVVDYHLKWIARAPDRARYLFFMRQAEFAEPAQAGIRAMNRELFQALFAWLKPYIAARQVKKLPPDIFAALLVGASQDFARHWLAGRVQTSITTARKLLAEAAWRALKEEGDRG